MDKSVASVIESIGRRKGTWKSRVTKPVPACVDRSRPKPANHFEALNFGGAWGGELYFEPNQRGFEPTDALPGSPDKIRVLIERLKRGNPLWPPEDRTDYRGLASQLGALTESLVVTADDDDEAL